MVFYLVFCFERERKRDKVVDWVERDDVSIVVCCFFREMRGEMWDVWFVLRMCG